MSTDIEYSIKQYVLTECLAGEDPDRLTPTTPLITTGILDSVATLKLVLFLESEFSITIEPTQADTDHLDTIHRIATLVRSKLG